MYYVTGTDGNNCQNTEALLREVLAERGEDARACHEPSRDPVPGEARDVAAPARDGVGGALDDASARKGTPDVSPVDHDEVTRGDVERGRPTDANHRERVRQIERVAVGTGDATAHSNPPGGRRREVAR
jgi:hypothetical protein